MVHPSGAPEVQETALLGTFLIFYSLYKRFVSASPLPWGRSWGEGSRTPGQCRSFAKTGQLLMAKTQPPTLAPGSNLAVKGLTRYLAGKGLDCV